jgi:hypothetical protein
MGHGFMRMMNIVDEAQDAFDDVARVMTERCAL